MERDMDTAHRIAELREACGYTRERMAQELDIDPMVYAGYEENGENIPISVVYQISKKFGVDFTEILTGSEAKLDTFHLVKSGQGRNVDRYPGYSYEDLAFHYNSKIMQPLLVRLDPSEDPAALVKHAGQEFNFMVEGTMLLVFDGKEIILEQGDSIYFNPTHLHGQKCYGDKPAVFLTVITE